MRRGSATGPLRNVVEPGDGDGLSSPTGVRFRPADLSSLLDPRGLRFQRLEWMAASVLDAMLALHAHAEPLCCSGRHVSSLCTDLALARRARECGLSSVIDWHAEDAKLADLVEACGGAAWLVSLSAAATCASALVHPGPQVGLVGVAAGEVGCAGLAEEAQLGAAVHRGS